MNGGAGQICVTGNRQHGASTVTDTRKALCRSPTGCDAIRRPRRTVATLKHYVVIYTVPRASPLNRRSRIRYAAVAPTSGDGASSTRCDATALCAIRAMPVPCGSAAANSAELHGTCARANATMAQRESKVYRDESSCVCPGRFLWTRS